LDKVSHSLQTLSIDELAKLFATISRYASVEEQSGKESPQFAALKQEVAKHLEEKATMLSFEDMIQWSLPLAAELVANERIWRRFMEIMIHNANKI
jgi:hypothetical protein